MPGSRWVDQFFFPSANSKNRYRTSLSLALGEWSGRLVMPTRFSAPSNRLTATEWLSDSHLLGGSSDPPETKNGLGAIDAKRMDRAIEQIGLTYEFKNPKPKAADAFDSSFLPPEADRKAN